MFSRALCLIAAALAVPALAHAYIDPGTTGMVVGGVAGILAWGLLALTILRKQVVRFFKFLFGGAAKHPLIAAIVILVPAGGATAAWLMMGEEEVIPAGQVSGTKFERVLLLGVDGVDPDDVKALMDKGLLPNFEKVAKAGSFKRMTIANPAQSPVVWSSLATGQNPGKHGIFDFIGRDPSRYLPKLAVLKQEATGGYGYPMMAKSMWDHTAANQIPTVVVRWPMTFQPERINGKVLAGLGVPDLRGGLGRYTYFTDAEIADDAEGKDKVVAVEVKDGAIDTVLTGPQTRGITGVKDLTVPLKAKIGADGKSVLVTVGKQNYSITQGGWSGWVDVNFSSGLFGKHRGLVKLHLASAKEPFAMYATPVEIHPDAPVVDFTYPPTYAKDMRDKIGLYHTLGMPEDTKAYGNHHLSEEAFFDMCSSVEAERRAMLLTELERFQKGLLAVVFDTSDRIQHMTPHEGDVEGTAIGRYLIEFDRFLGGVLTKVPADTPVIIFSDHGFSEFKRTVDLNRWLAQNGYLKLDDEGFAKRAAGDNGELYKYVKWEETRAYAIGFAGVFLNIEGREGKGVVPAAERAALAKEIAEKLRGLKDGETPVVHQVYIGPELYQGPEAENAPDIVLGFKPGYRGSWQSAVGGLAEQVFDDNDKLWQRDHIVDPSFVEASLITNFAVNVEQPDVRDLAPTVMSMLGVPIPTEIEGRPLHLQQGQEVARAAATPVAEATP